MRKTLQRPVAAMLKCAVLFSCLFLMLGCNSFDRTTFNTLAASQAVLATAQADYEAGTLPHTVCVYNLINKGKTAQTLAVTAFGQYYQIEQAKASTAAAEAVVVADVANIAPIIVSIKSLYSNPNCGA